MGEGQERPVDIDDALADLAVDQCGADVLTVVELVFEATVLLRAMHFRPGSGIAPHHPAIHPPHPAPGITAPMPEAACRTRSPPAPPGARPASRAHDFVSGRGSPPRQRSSSDDRQTQRHQGPRTRLGHHAVHDHQPGLRYPVVVVATLWRTVMDCVAAGTGSSPCPPNALMFGGGSSRSCGLVCPAGTAATRALSMRASRPVAHGAPYRTG